MIHWSGVHAKRQAYVNKEKAQKKEMLTESCNSADNRTIVSHYQFLWKTHKNQSCIYMFRAGVPGCFPPRSTLRSFPLISFISASLKCNSDCSDCTCGTSSISMSSCETFHRASVKLVCRTFLDSSFSRSL